MANAKVAPKTGEKARSSRPACYPCCAPFCGFLVLGLICVPVAVFGISAFFALPLWGLECAEAMEMPGYVDLPWYDENNLCSYYRAYTVQPAVFIGS